MQRRIWSHDGVDHRLTDQRDEVVGAIRLHVSATSRTTPVRRIVCMNHIASARLSVTFKVE